MRFLFGSFVVFASFMFQMGAQAQPSTSAAANNAASDEIVSYDSAFFSQYQPRTALDMVRQVPGFILNDGDNTRGFGAAAGNVLINGRRPSAKQNTPSEFLTRIASSQVEKIELIRAQVRGVDMLGHSALVNIILHGDMPAVVRWEASIRHNNRGPVKPAGDISLTDRWGDVDYTAGVMMEREANGEQGNRENFDGTGLLDDTTEVEQESTGIQMEGSLSASTWFGETLVNANGKISSDGRNPRQKAVITPQNPLGATRQEFIEDELTIKGLEIGTDAVRNLGDELLGKAIILYFKEKIPKVSTRQLINSSGTQTLLRIADGDTDSTEAIARLEFNWTGIEGHSLQFNLESAYNAVEGTLVQTDDTGAGPVTVVVPGANSKVDEVRWDLQIKDNWSVGKFEFDAGLGAEFSTISQTGDSEQERDFQFLKPMASAIWTPNRGHRFRLHVEREIAQLDFGDFISTTVFEDDDVLLGNPDLHPDATWISEFGYEYRYGKVGVIRVTAYYHWIKDVLDLLPLTATNAVPGNIGDGKRWGTDLETTLPLDWTGLENAKLSLTGRWQDSSVTDPVSGEDRVLSAQGGNTAYRSLMTGNRNLRYFLRMDFRQDFESTRTAWGWTVAERDERPLFKVNELDVYNDDVAIDAFVETTRWWDLRIRVLGENLLDFREWRDRTVYTGARELSPVNFHEIRNRHNGRKITLSFSGSF